MRYDNGTEKPRQYTWYRKIKPCGPASLGEEKKKVYTGLHNCAKNAMGVPQLVTWASVLRDGQRCGLLTWCANDEQF